VENAKTGTSAWRLSNPATNREIEGYASATSVNRGQQINFYVNTASSSYTIDVYRMGWYGGQGGRQVAGPVTLSGTSQSIPTPNSTTGLTSCNWINPYTLTTSVNWTSGYYLAKLTATNNGKQSYIIFVVRDDSSNSKYLVQSPVTTYQAYNNWGGKALYGFRSTNSIPAVKVSFNRPYGLGENASSAAAIGAGEFITNFAPSNEASCAGWEYNLVRFLEREGYDVTYCTDVDTHATGGSLLLNHKGFLSSGHDEYWSWEMRSNAEAARDAGVSLGFFGSNACYWQIRFEADANGVPNRTIVAYKSNADTQDPYAIDSTTSNDYLITRLWRDNTVKPPEEALIGQMYVTDPVNANLVIEDASNWVCANTGLKDGDSLLGLVGYEVDCMFFGGPAGTARIGHSMYTYSDGASVFPDVTVYTASSGATVFATGSMQWSWGLDDYNSPALRPPFSSAAAQQMTRNVLASFVGARPAGSTPSVTLTFSDTLDDNAMDANKWSLGAIESTLTAGSSAWDPNVTVLEQNQRLEITPRSRMTGSHYNGYVSLSTVDLTNASASVEVVQAASGGADTYLALCIDAQNHYKIEKEGTLLYFTQVLAGATTESSTSYSPDEHRFWRIRHILSTESIVFETSADRQVWTMRDSFVRKFSVKTLKLEIGAGTSSRVDSPGTAIFDNPRVERRATTATAPAPTPTPFPTATPTPAPTPAPTATPVPETVSAPNKPSGPTAGYTSTAYTFSTGGSVDNLGRSVQYLFNWGDGTTSGWLPVGTTSARKAWAYKNVYTITAQARSSTNTSVVSASSTWLNINITVAETVSTPKAPTGPTSGYNNGTLYTYSTGSAVDNLGHSVQYLFNWGDGTTSGWLPVGTTSARKSWPYKGTYTVKAQARCATHTSVVSAFSTGTSVNITLVEAVSTPAKPWGPTSVYPSTSYTYYTGGSTNNLGYSVQYLFNWGDGTTSGWLPVGTTSARHAWTYKKVYTVKAQARSATHTSVVSTYSTGLSVTVATKF
jgi:hypothetical protein